MRINRPYFTDPILSLIFSDIIITTFFNSGLCSASLPQNVDLEQARALAQQDDDGVLVPGHGRQQQSRVAIVVFLVDDPLVIEDVFAEQRFEAFSMIISLEPALYLLLAKLVASSLKQLVQDGATTVLGWGVFVAFVEVYEIFLLKSDNDL